MAEAEWEILSMRVGLFISPRRVRNSPTEIQTERLLEAFSYSSRLPNIELVFETYTFQKALRICKYIS